MIVVTSARPFLDIDGYGASVAYAELLNLQGKEAVAASTSKMNASICPLVREWQTLFRPHYRPEVSDRFVVVDISDPEFLDSAVDITRVDEIIDHHPGFEDIWRDKIGDKAQIEFVGAASTLVYERWGQAGLLEKISQTSARLLACGILDNTLNLKAKITTERDRQAYAALARLGDLPKNWAEQYFSDCQKSILRDARQAVADDTKATKYPSRGDTLTVGQLAIWDAGQVLDIAGKDIKAMLESKGEPWYMNLISIKDGRSHLWCEDVELKQWLANLLGVKFNGNLATADRMWLRKEIMKLDIQRSAS